MQRMEQAWHAALAQSSGPQPTSHIVPSTSPTAAGMAAATATVVTTANLGASTGLPAPTPTPTPQQQIQLSLEQRAFYDLNPARTSLNIYGPALGALWGSPNVNNIAASVTVQPSLVAHSVLSPTLAGVTSLTLSFVEHGKIMESLPLIAQMTQLRALALTHNHITALFQLEPLMVLSASNIDTLTLSPNPVTVACPSLYVTFAVALLPRLRTVDGASITPVLERRAQVVFGGLVAAWRTPNLSRPKLVKPAWLSLLTSEPVRKVAPPSVLSSASSSLLQSLASSSSLPGLASSASGNASALSFPAAASASGLATSAHSGSATSLLSGSPSADFLAAAAQSSGEGLSTSALHGSSSSSLVGTGRTVAGGVGAAAAAAAAVGAVTSIVVSRSGRSSQSLPWSIPVPPPWYDTAPHHGNPNLPPSGLHTVLYACVYLTALSLSKRTVAQTQSRNRKTARTAVEQWMTVAWASHERHRRVAQKFPAILRKLIRATLDHNLRPESLNAVLASRLTMAQAAAAEAAREAAAAAKAAQEAKERAAAEASMGSAFGSWGMGGIGSSAIRGGASLGVVSKP